MKLQQTIHDKFSVILFSAMFLLIMPLIAAAQDKIVFYGDRDSGNEIYSRHSGGINAVLMDGSVRFSAEVSRISLPNSPLEYDFVDAHAPNAVSKTRALLDAADRMRCGIVITVPRGALGSAIGRVLTVELLVREGSSSYLEVKLQDALITSYSISGSGAAMESYSLNFTKIEYKTVPN